MFMLTRFGTYTFSVRLRMPKAVRIEDAAKVTAPFGTNSTRQINTRSPRVR